MGCLPIGCCKHSCVYLFITRKLKFAEWLDSKLHLYSFYVHFLQVEKLHTVSLGQPVGFSINQVFDRKKE